MTASVTLQQMGWLLIRAASSYQRELSPGEPSLWLARLADYEFDELRQALDAHIDRSPRFPTIADVASLASPARRQREARERRRAAFAEEFEDKWQFVQVLAPDGRLERETAWAYWIQGETDWWMRLMAEAKSKNYEIGREMIAASGWSLRP